MDVRDTISKSIDEAWGNVVKFGPKLAAFLLILLVGYLVAVALGRIITKALKSVGFDRLVEHGAFRQALEKSGYKMSGILGHLAFYALFLFVLQMAFAVFGPNPISDLLKQMISFLPNILVAIVILVVAGATAGFAKEVIASALGGLSYGAVAASATSAAIIVLAVFAALTQLQIAETIINGLFYAMLSVIAGSLIVAVGGGGIAPMRAKWEQALTRLEEEPPRPPAADTRVASAPASETGGQ